MGKALKTAGAIIGGAVLMATGVGALAGMQVTAMGIAGVGTMSVANLQLMSAGLMAAGSMLDKPKSTASGSPSDWTSNPDQGTPFLFGRMGVGGKIVHRDEYGPDNRLQGIVTVYSGAGPVKSFQGFAADELPVSFESNGGTAIGKYRRQMWRSWRMGNQPDTALSLPTGLDGGAVMPMWGAAYRLSGKACDLLTMQMDSKFSVYPSGEPKPMQVLEGVFGYDPRYDSTYPGGAGPCRYGVRSTYRYIDNAIIAALNWALGMVENGLIVGGIGASLQGVDLPAFIEAANIADANAWTVAAWPDTSEDASVVLDELLEAGGAKRSRVAGKISCVSRGAPRPSIVTITRRDTAGAIELDTGASRFNRLNTITPVIMSESHKWTHAPMNPVSFAPLVAEDGGKRSDQIKYRFVSKVKQGAELAAYDILDAREPFSGTIPLLPHLRRLKPGDCFDIDEPGFMLDGVKMLVLSRSYDPKAGEVRIAFRSETDSKHPLALGKTTTMPDYPGLTVPDPTEVSGPLPGDWTIVPRPPGESGVQVPIIDIIGEVSNGTATAVHFEWWVVPGGVNPSTPPPTDADWQSAGIWPPTVTSIPVQADPGVVIWIAASYLRGENFSERKFYGPVTVPGLTAGNVVPTAPTIVAMQDAIDLASDGIEALDNAVGTLNATVYTAGTGLLARTDAMFDTLNTPTTGVLARMTTVENKQTSDNSAAVNRLNALEATVNTPSTGLVARMATQESATVSLQTGKADVSRVAALEATVNTPGTGLSARMGAAETAVTNLQTQKASVERVATLEAFATSAVSPVPFDAVGAENFYTEAIEGGAAAPSSRIVAVAGEGKVFELQLVYLSTLGGAVLSDSGAYRVRARVRRTEDPAAGDRRVTLYLAAFDRAEQYLGALSSVVESDLTIGMGWREVASQLWKTEAVRTAFPAAHTVRPVVRGGSTISPSGNGTIQAKYLNLDAQGDTSVLAGRVTTLETAAADLQAGKADATRVAALEATVNTPGSGLIGKVGSLEAATADLQAQKADATRVEVLEATALGARPTTINDAAGTFFSQGGAGTAPLGNAKVGQDASGYYFKSSDTGAWIARGLVPIASGQVITVAGVWDQEVTGDSARITAWAFDAAGTMTAVTGPVTMFPVGAGNRITRSFGLAGAGAETTLPAGTVAARFGLQPNRTSAGSVRGRSLTIADGTLASTLNARVGTLETATANLQTGKADAARVTSLEATVNTPGTGLTARLTTVESVAASADGTAKAIKGVVLDVNGYVSGFASTNDGTTSSFEVLAAAFAIRDPSAGERTEYRAGNWYVYSPSENTRTRYGKAFGGTQKLVWWTGPSSVAEGSETKANAYVYMSQNTVSGPRFGGSDIVGGSGVLTATASSLIVQGGRNGAGGVSTSTTTVTAAGGNSGASMRWVKVSGDDLVANSPSSFTTSFYGTVGTGQSKSAVFMGVVTKAGQQAAVYVQADIADNGT